MINYDLKDNAVTHFPAIFKGLGSKPSVIHMALDVELHGGVLIVRVAGGRNIIEGQRRGLMFDFDFHAVPQCWWGPHTWPKLRAKLFAHDPWLIQMLEHHQRLLVAQQHRITELE